MKFRYLFLFVLVFIFIAIPQSVHAVNVGNSLGDGKPVYEGFGGFPADCVGYNKWNGLFGVGASCKKLTKNGDKCEEGEKVDDDFCNISGVAPYPDSGGSCPPNWDGGSRRCYMQSKLPTGTCFQPPFVGEVDVSLCGKTPDPADRTKEMVTPPAQPATQSLSAETISQIISADCEPENQKCIDGVRQCLSIEQGDIDESTIKACFELYTNNAQRKNECSKYTSLQSCNAVDDCEYWLRVNECVLKGTYEDGGASPVDHIGWCKQDYSNNIAGCLDAFKECNVEGFVTPKIRKFVDSVFYCIDSKLGIPHPAAPALPAAPAAGFNCNDNECYNKEEGKCRQIGRMQCGTGGSATMSTASNGDCVFSACQEPADRQVPSTACRLYDGDISGCNKLSHCAWYDCAKQCRAKGTKQEEICPPDAKPAREIINLTAPRTPVSPTEEEEEEGQGDEIAVVDRGRGLIPSDDQGKGEVRTCKGENLTYEVLSKRLEEAKYPGPYAVVNMQQMLEAYNKAACPNGEQTSQAAVTKPKVKEVKVNGKDVGKNNPKVPLNLLDLCGEDFFAGKCVVTVEIAYTSGDPKRIALKLKPASSLTNKEAGQPCNKTAQCKQGLICIGDDDARQYGLPKDRCYPNPKVTTKLPDGADCVTNEQCVSGDCRTGGTCDTPGGCKGKCIGGGKPGEFCRHDSECPSGYFCPGNDEAAKLNIQNDRCTSLSARTSGGGSTSGGSSSSGSGSGSTGSSCGVEQRKPSGSKCLGQTCSQDSECKTGYCCTGDSCTNKGKCTNANGSI